MAMAAATSSSSRFDLLSTVDLEKLSLAAENKNKPPFSEGQRGFIIVTITPLHCILIHISYYNYLIR